MSSPRWLAAMQFGGGPKGCWGAPLLYPPLSVASALQVLGEQLGRRGDVVAPLRPMLNRTLADVRHRLVFRAHTFIKVRPAGVLAWAT